MFNTEDEEEKEKAARLRCTGYDQFMQSLHCQFFHSGGGAVRA